MRRPALALVVTLLAASGCEDAHRLPQPGESVSLKLVGGEQWIAGDLVSVAVQLQATDAEGNSRLLNCDVGELVDHASVVAHVRFFDGKGNELPYDHVPLKWH